jgi:hypothetical protein
MIRTIPLLAVAATFAAAAPQAWAADLGVLTSLDVCDALGTAGVTLSSDANCIKISGSVYYEFSTGNYGERLQVLPPLAISGEPDDDQVSVIDDDGGPDWYSYVEAYLRVEAVANSDFGPARAVIDLYGYEEHEWINNAESINDVPGVSMDYAYVAIGDTTVITAGLNDDSIINVEDDVPYDWLGTLNSNYIGDGVDFANNGGGDYDTAGHVITVVSTFENGFKAGIGLESLEAEGSLVGFVSYNADDAPLSGHLSFVAGDVLDGTFDDWAIHTGLTASIDAFKASAALALNDTGWWNAIFTGEATFDIFTIAGSIDGTSADELGTSGSITAKVTDEVTLKVGGRWTDFDTGIDDNEATELRGRIEYAVTEALTLGGEVGYYADGSATPNGDDSIFDVLADLSWSPVDSAYTATLAGAVNSYGGYKTTFTAEKSFE